MDYETVLRTIETASAFAVAIIAWRALYVWKREVRGRDKYQLAKNLLEKLKEVRFIIHTPKSVHQIYLNDLLVRDSKMIYEEWWNLFANEQVLVDGSYWHVSHYLDIRTRSEILLPKKIRDGIDDVLPGLLKNAEKSGVESVYMQIFAPANEKPQAVVGEANKDTLYKLDGYRTLTFKEYFSRWEKLLKELQKEVYE